MTNRPCFTLPQGQILAVWILAGKLPNSDLNFPGDFGVDFSSFSKEKDPQKATIKSTRACGRLGPTWGHFPGR